MIMIAVRFTINRKMSDKRVAPFARFGAVFFFALAVLLTAAGSVWADRADIWIWGGEKKAVAMEASMRAAGVEAVLLDDPARLDDLADGEAPRGLAVAPGKRIPPGARPAVEWFLQNGGALMVWDPAAFDYSRELLNPISLADLSSGESHTLRRPGSSAVNPEPVVEGAVLAADGDRGAGLRVSTKLIGDGDVLVNIPLRGHRSAERAMVGFAAKGSEDVRILTLRLDDETGRTWIAFVELDFDWQTYAVPMADFLPTDGDPVDQPDPETVRVFSVGMVSRVLWPEVAGEFSVADFVLGEESAHAGVRSAVPGAWRVQYAALGIDAPAWLRDPFAGSRPVKTETLNPVAPMGSAETRPTAVTGRVWSVPNPPHERGRERTELLDILMRDEQTRRVLFAADGGEPVVGWFRANGGDRTGAQLLLGGLPDEDFGPDSPWGRFAAEAAWFLTNRPKIARVTPVLTEWGETVGGRMVCRVLVDNPGRQAFTGTVEVNVAGKAGGETEVAVGPGERIQAEVPVSTVPEDFPFNDFSWRVTLLHGGREVDRMEDRVRTEELIQRVADYAVGLQAAQRDGRFTHHFFADHYAARLLLPLAESLRESDPEKAARYREAALRFADMIADRQRDDGAFPMGYGEHRDIIFVADLGQICLGLVHLASLLDPEDPRRGRYLETVRRYLPFRQSFRQTPERVARLEEEFGADPTRIREGFYGIGLLGSDYFDGGRWDGLRPEHRGRWWVLPVSMGFLGAWARLEDEPVAKEIGKMDLRVYLDGGFELTTAAYFHAETLFWMYYGIDDEDLRRRLREKLSAELPPKLFRNEEGIPLELQGRASLWWLSLLYYHRYFEERGTFRNAFVQGLWVLGSDTSSMSVSNVMEKYPQAVYGPSIGAFRYAVFSAFWVRELLEEGSTLLPGDPFPSYINTNQRNTP